MLQLSDSTRLGIQAAVAVIIAVAVSHLLKLDRSYWAIVTALVLISQTWGES